MARYYADPEHRRVAALIDAEVRKAREAEKAGGWITYLIRDPRGYDKRGNTGVPIYVGQTKEFGRRVRSRFDRCEKAATARDSIERRLSELLHLGIVAQYQVLERAPTRLTSLVSETRWARLCVSRGYDIANRWAEHRATDLSFGRHDVPAVRLWEFTLDEAIEDAIVIQLGCRSCRQTLDIDLVHFLRVGQPPTDLRGIKANPFWRLDPCTVCGVHAHRFVRPRVTESACAANSGRSSHSGRET